MKLLLFLMMVVVMYVYVAARDWHIVAYFSILSMLYLVYEAIIGLTKVAQDILDELRKPRR